MTIVDAIKKLLVKFGYAESINDIPGQTIAEVIPLLENIIGEGENTNNNSGEDVPMN